VYILILEREHDEGGRGATKVAGCCQVRSFLARKTQSWSSPAAALDNNKKGIEYCPSMHAIWQQLNIAVDRNPEMEEGDTSLLQKSFLVSVDNVYQVSARPIDTICRIQK
jgi:hypothetical protein